MTLPKSNSRPIDVDGLRFRHAVSVSATDEAGLFSLNLAVQVASGHGRILKARGLLTRDRWLDFPELDTPDRYPILKPGHVAAVIRRARDGGWHPEQAGTPFLLEIGPDVLQT
jgi:hypothetical protein